jgi:hypothetical protein
MKWNFKSPMVHRVIAIGVFLPANEPGVFGIEQMVCAKDLQKRGRSFSS